MATKVAIITGGSSGIGKKATEKLMKQGVHCIIASRNLENVNEAIKDLKKTTKRDNIEGMSLDLTDPDSIRTFVQDFNTKNIPLNILVNNAGIQTTQKRLTKNGVESTFSANHLGHFLLTNLLLDKLKASSPSHVVVVASNMHNPKKGIAPRPELPIEEYNFDKRPYDAVAAYRFSKLANLWFTFELSRRLQGTGVAVNALCPGWIPTTALARDYGVMMRPFMYIMSWMPFTRSLDHGADSIVDLTQDTQTQSGEFYVDRKISETSPRARDVSEQTQMWDLSMRLSGLAEAQ